VSWMVSGWVKKSRLGSGSRKGVMLVVADYCTEDAKQIGVEIPEGHAVCWAGIDVIAAEAEVSERTVRRVLDEMEEAGVIRRERRHDARGWRVHDVIWVEYARMFVDLTDWSPTRTAAPEPDESNRTECPLGLVDQPVDNSPAGHRLADTGDTPSGHWRHRLADTGDTALIRKNPQLEPPANRQDHLGNAATERAWSTPENGSSSIVGAAPSATARPPPGTSPRRPPPAEEISQ
jgi:hypothetical protein